MNIPAARRYLSNAVTHLHDAWRVSREPRQPLATDVDYAQIMLGHIDDAQAELDKAKAEMVIRIKG